MQGRAGPSRLTAAGACKLAGFAATPICKTSDRKTRPSAPRRLTCAVARPITRATPPHTPGDLHGTQTPSPGVLRRFLDAGARTDRAGRFGPDRAGRADQRSHAAGADVAADAGGGAGRADGGIAPRCGGGAGLSGRGRDGSAGLCRWRSGRGFPGRPHGRLPVGLRGAGLCGRLAGRTRAGARAGRNLPGHAGHLGPALCPGRALASRRYPSQPAGRGDCGHAALRGR